MDELKKIAEQKGISVEQLMAERKQKREQAEQEKAL